MLLRRALIAAACGMALYALAGAYVASHVRAGSLEDDPGHELDAHALLSIMMCWPHDAQSLRH